MCVGFFLFAFKDQNLFAGKWPAKFACDCFAFPHSPVFGTLKTKQSIFEHLSCIWISLFINSPPSIWEVYIFKVNFGTLVPQIPMNSYIAC